RRAGAGRSGTSPRSSGDRALPSGGRGAGSNPAGGTHAQARTAAVPHRAPSTLSVLALGAHSRGSPGWPDDPATVTEARQHPEVFAHKGVGGVAAYQQVIIEKLDRKPAVIGHSFGGPLAQILAGRGLSAATVAIDPAPSRGVLPLPVSALKASAAVLTNPANRRRAVALTYEQFRYGFANAVSEEEAQGLYETYSVAGSGVPIFQAAFANINPRTEAKADNRNPQRGPMLVVSGERDHQVPWAIAKATFDRQQENQNPTEIVEVPGRGHSLTIDAGWQQVAQLSLDFIRRFV
ncbi:MAG: Pimeloyl-ACP methyl ester carboxylesterase, partial [Modestobacter sp.]|nr:Pimeloyl-ACP methyl ester carboxylesterase [Modestobacter sp.]